MATSNIGVTLSLLHQASGGILSALAEKYLCQRKKLQRFERKTAITRSLPAMNSRSSVRHH